MRGLDDQRKGACLFLFGGRLRLGGTCDEEGCHRRGKPMLIL
jgi:hypothetical protein